MPGNPGIARMYVPLLAYLRRRLGPSAALVSVSYAGHVPGPHNTPTGKVGWAGGWVRS